MDLDLALNSWRRLSPLTPPELTRLESAKRRVLQRWPDIVPDPPERDHEKIIADMLDLLREDRWGDVKLSTVLRALKVAFNPNFRQRDDVAEILRFAYEELEATSQATFLNTMVSVYLSSYEPGADHSKALGNRVAAKKVLLNGKWRELQKIYPSLFDGRSAHLEIAAAMLDMDNPWRQLQAQGFSDPHGTGLWDHVHLAFIEQLRPNLNMESWVDTLFTWLNPDQGKRKQSGSIEVIEAILVHWLGRRPQDGFREAVTERLINQYNDPRVNRGLWHGVREDCMNVIFSWLTREDLRFFTSVVDATQRDPQWQPRKKFWLQLYDEGLIEQAWVAFCPSAERYARTHLSRSGAQQNLQRFGRQSKGGTRSDTSILIMKIGNKIVVDGCHNYRTHMFNIDDPVAPKLFRREYDCDSDVMNLAPWSKAHNSIPNWSQWVRESIRARIPMSTKKSWRSSSARDDFHREPPSPAAQRPAYMPPQPARSTYTPPTQGNAYSPRSTGPAPATRPQTAAEPPVQRNPAPTTAASSASAATQASAFQGRAATNPTPVATPNLRAEARSAAQRLASSRRTGAVEQIKGVTLPKFPSATLEPQKHRPATAAVPDPTPPRSVPDKSTTRSGSGVAIFSVQTARAEAEMLRERLEAVNDNTGGIKQLLYKVMTRRELKGGDATLIAVAINRHRRSVDEFVTLEAYVNPIFNRTLSQDERRLWAAKADMIESLATTRGVISPNVRSALQALKKGANVTQQERNAMEFMAQKLRLQGVELLEIILKE